MAVPGTGKSTFAQEYPRYHGLYIVDFPDINGWVFGKQGKWMRRVVLFLRYLRKSSHLLLAGEMSRHDFASDLSFAGAQIRKQLMQSIQKHDSSARSSDRIIYYLRHQRGPICVLTAAASSINQDRYDDIKFAVVMIPLEEHRDHLSNRRETDPTNRAAADFSYAITRREILLQIAEARNVPVYQSFEAAIDDLAESPAE